jgi:hypothetical protein
VSSQKETAPDPEILRHNLRNAMQAVEGLRNRIKVLEESAPRWQSITTAPKDGFPFLAAGTTGPIVVLAYWDSYDQQFKDHHRIPLAMFTHWMPLPKAPGGIHPSVD